MPQQGNRRTWRAAAGDADQRDAAGPVGGQPKSSRWRQRSGAVEFPSRTAGGATAGQESTQEDDPMALDDDTAAVEEEAALPPRSKPRQFPRTAAPRSELLPAHSDGTLSVCVIGGGPAGLGCCRALCDAGLQVTLVQESRGLGGKLCTKFVNGKEDPTLHFDMGVQLLWPDGPLREVLDESVVQPWPAPGRFKRIHCSGEWRAWKVDRISDIPTDGYVVGVPSMSSIGRHLASKCEGLTIHLDRSGTVRGQDPKTFRWEVEWKREAPTATQLRYRPELKGQQTEVGRGDFDAVFLAFEANKILRGCKSGYKMVSASSTDAIRKQVAGRAKTSQIWNLMVAFDKELPMPWDAATIEGHPALAWVAVNSSKPQRAKVPQCFQLLSTKSWADWKQWSKREVEQELLEELLDFLAHTLGKRPPKPCFVLAGRWGNNTETVLTGARPVGEFPMKAVDFYAGKPSVVWDGVNKMGATGDWTSGFSVSDAYNAGLHAAAPLLKELGRSDAAMGA